MKRILSLLMVLVLTVTAAFCLSSCSDDEYPFPTSSRVTVPKLPSSSNMKYGEIGKGKTQYILVVENAFEFESKEKYIVKTDKKYLGESLLELEFIKGKKTQYGLFVDTVMGITVDNKTEFWAIYIDGKQSQVGIDSIEIKAGKTYVIKREKIK